MHRGYVKLWRKLRDNPLWLAEPFTRGQAWVDLLMLANHRPNTIIKRGISIEILPGQVLACEQFLSDRWKWSRGKVRRYLRNLEQQTAQQIVQQKTNVSTIVTILNWSEYQSSSTADSTANDTPDGQQTDNRKTTDGHTEECINTTNTTENKNKPRKKFSFDKSELPYQSKEFMEAWDGLMEVRKAKKAVNSEKALKILITNINKIAPTESEAIRQLNRAIENSWKTVYPDNGFGKGNDSKKRQHEREQFSFTDGEEVTNEM